MVPQVGQKIGPYEILGRLGTGGMGLVFSAWDSRLLRDVAIKLLRDEYLTPTMRSRFLGEARAASRLNHPNICTIFDIGEQQGDPYLVMELLKGDTLRSRLAQGPMPLEDIVRVATEMADALTVAHEQGIVHRDIKPANVVLVDKPSGRFQTKVLDFGLAKVVPGDIDLKSHLTSTGMTVGTVSYMSPEQARGEPLDGRSDLFSLGVLLYEMVSGKLPFSGATSALIFVQLLNESPEPVRKLNNAIPRELEQVIDCCLKKDRAQRYQSAHELVEALHRVKLDRPAEGKPASTWLSRLTTKLAGAEETGTSAPSASLNNTEGPTPAEPEKDVARSTGESILHPVKRVVSSDGEVSLRRWSPPPPRGAKEPAPASLAAEPAASEGAKASDVGDEKRGLVATEAAPQPEALPQGTASLLRDTPGEALPLSRIVLPALTPTELNRPVPRFQKLGLDDEGAPPAEDDDNHTGPTRGTRILLGILIALLALIASLYVLLRKHSPPAPAGPARITLAPLVNHTGDSSLDSVVSAGLSLALQQSASLTLLDPSGIPALPALDAADVLEKARIAAKGAGAQELVIGEVRADHASYLLLLRVMDTGSGSQRSEVSEVATNREQIVSAVDRLALDLRSALGERSGSINKTSAPLRLDGTANADALQAYALGQKAQTAGHPLEAIVAFQHAVAIDEHFAQAHLRLADLYAGQFAEVSAATAAAQASSNARQGSERTRSLSEAAYALYAEQNPVRAGNLLAHLRQVFSADVDATTAIASAYLAQGRFAEALEAANAALKVSPLSRNALNCAQAALLGLNQVDAAAHITPPLSRLNGVNTDLSPLVSYLASTAVQEPAAADGSETVPSVAAEIHAAAVLDASGRFASGLLKWHEVANHARSIPELGSAGSYALTQAALNRALIADCATSADLLREAAGLPAGAAALFAGGTAAGLCGDLSETRRTLSLLSSSYGQTFAAKSFYISGLTALLQWKSGSAPDALLTLHSAQPYDGMSLNPFLRGVVYLSSQQPQMAIVEFQGLLQHRSATTLVNAVAYPAAEFNLARSYAATGDTGNRDQSYNQLLALWAAAEGDNVSLAEARSAVNTSR